MTHKFIDIPEETYIRLTELKRVNETIPDLLTRLIASSNDLKEGLSEPIRNKIIDKLNLALKKFKEDTINLQDDWDGQGSKGFSEELWQNVIDFLLLIYIELHAEDLEAPFPLVLPNVDGSLDIDWETESFELLINFPPDPEELIHMFGEKMGSPKNELDVRINRELASLVVSEWLKKIL